VVAHAKAIAAAGHIGLVESFAQRLAEACFEEPRVLRARVRVEKPHALAPDAAAAGVEITAVRT
jgi:dihydroneopterin aldolase